MNRLTALSLLGGGIVASTSRPLSAQGLPQVRAVATALDQSGALYYAYELGIFTKHGLDVSITTPNDNALAVPSVVSNSVDFAYTNIVAIEQAFRKGIPITIVAPAAVNDARFPNNFLLVPKDSPIKTPLDLQGKTLGTAPLKSLGDTATNASLYCVRRSHGQRPDRRSIYRRTVCVSVAKHDAAPRAAVRSNRQSVPWCRVFDVEAMGVGSQRSRYALRSGDPRSVDLGK
jgi:ABC-type nitrate/sulfonate/bicarbonate transport system substrate-binding protein